MYNLLIRLMLISALVQFGISLKDASECRSRACASRLERAARAVLEIQWKPISVWPEEAKRFQ